MSPTEDLPPSREEFLDRLLWLEPTEIKSDGKGDGGRRFLEAFAKAAEEILQIRREGSMPHVDIEDSKVCAALDQADRDHLQSFRAGAGRALPLSLAWSIGFLGRHLGQASLLSTQAIAEISSISERLAKTHLEAMATFRGTREHNSLINRARRIVELVEASNERVDLRDITRHFKAQQQSLFLPLLDVLVYHKVLVKHGDREYSRGDVDFEPEMFAPGWEQSTKKRKARSESKTSRC
jgi:hypothetical protein